MKNLRNNKDLILSIFKISLPAIIEMGLNTLVGISDTIMLSFYVGKDALAAAGNANQIILTIILIFSSFNVGATAIISRSFGEKNFKKLNNTSCQNLSLNVLIGFLIMLLTVIFTKNIMSVFQTTDEVYKLGVSFLNIVSFSLLFMFISFAAAASLRGIGNTVTPMLITGGVNILNVILNIVLIKGLWIFPEMGFSGSAVATTISRIIGAALYLVVFIKNDSYLKIRIASLKLTRDIQLPLWKLSITAGIEQFLTQFAFLISGVIITILDTDSETGFRVLLTIEQISIMPAIGISIAAATLVGKALGESDAKKAHFTGYTCFGMGIIWGILIGLFFIVFPVFTAGLFTNDPAVKLVIVSTLFFVGLDQPLLNYIFVVSGALRGAGDTITVMIFTTMRLWFIFIPLAYLSVKYIGMGVKSIWVAEIISLIVFSVIMYIRFVRGKWAKIKIS